MLVFVALEDELLQNVIIEKTQVKNIKDQRVKLIFKSAKDDVFLTLSIAQFEFLKAKMNQINL